MPQRSTKSPEIGSRPRLRVKALAALLVIAIAAIAAWQILRTAPGGSTGSTGGVAIPTNALYVSASNGSDFNPGTESRPWRTLGKAVAGASAGATVVLEPGTYGEMGGTITFGRSGGAAAPIVFTSAPGQPQAAIRGYVRVTGSHLRLNALRFEGPTGPVAPRTAENPGGQEVQLSIMYGSDVTVSDSEVSGNAWHAGVFVSQATEVRLAGDYIHGNGDAATGGNLDHGIYWYGGSGSITDSRIEDNVAYGIQLYPEPADVLVAHNTISGNGRGGIIVSERASDSVIRNNLIVGNGEYGIRAYKLTGSGNVAAENLIWESGKPTDGTGIEFTGTVEAEPSTLPADRLTNFGVEGTGA